MEALNEAVFLHLAYESAERVVLTSAMIPTIRYSFWFSEESRDGCHELMIMMFI